MTRHDNMRAKAGIPPRLACDVCETEMARFYVKVTDMKGVVLDSAKVCPDCADEAKVECTGEDYIAIITPTKEDMP